MWCMRMSGYLLRTYLPCLLGSWIRRVRRVGKVGDLTSYLGRRNRRAFYGSGLVCLASFFFVEILLQLQFQTDLCTGLILGR